MLQTMARRAEYEAGVLLCRQGAVEDTFYIILDGAVDVSQEIDNGRERHLATLAAGGYFGEMGLLDNRPRLANVTTRVPTTVLEIDGATLQRVIEASPQIGHELTRRILAILRANDENLWQAVLEKEAAQKELEIGRRIQQSFLPPDMPRLPGWEIISHLQPAGVVSGDFYDAMVFDDSRVLLVLGDVCDKGVGAALYMALFRSLVRAFAEHHYHSHRREREQGQSAAESIVATMRDTLQQTILFTNSYLTRHHARTNMFATSSSPSWSPTVATWLTSTGGTSRPSSPGRRASAAGSARRGRWSASYRTFRMTWAKSGWRRGRRCSPLPMA